VARVKGSLLSIVGALLVGAAIFAISGQSPLRAYYTVLTGGFGSLQGFMQLLAYATPLVFTGLGVALAFQAGVFNIGGEGQLCLGACAATITGIYFQAPWPLPLLAALFAGGMAGALWALLPGLLVGRTPAALVVATIMMNSIGTLLVEWLIRYHFQKPGSATVETISIQAGAVLPRFAANSQLNYGLVLGFALVAAVWFLLHHTTIGFSFRAVGGNPTAARQAGIQVFRQTLLALVCSGALCGLGGAVVILGVYQRFLSGFSPGYGWDGITVAILASNNPIGVIFSAGLFGMLRSASISMNLGTKIPVDLVTVLQGLIVCFVAAPQMWEGLRSRMNLDFLFTWRGDSLKGEGPEKGIEER